MHDLGKRAIPKEILNKEGALTDDERHAMMQHPQCGYPNHLAGKDIPQFGMIIHVADVYDALIRKRTYKDRFLQKEAVEYLMANCGTMFDLDIVNTFLNYLVVYPVGSTVKLSTGQTARVVQNRRKTIMRPVVVTEDDKEVIDLANHRKYLNVVIEMGQASLVAFNSLLFSYMRSSARSKTTATQGSPPYFATPQAITIPPLSSAVRLFSRMTSTSSSICS